MAKSMLRNQERVDRIIQAHGDNAFEIHSVAGTDIKIAFYVTEKSKPDYRAIVYKPHETDYSILPEIVNEEQKTKIIRRFEPIQERNIADSADEGDRFGINILIGAVILLVIIPVLTYVFIDRPVINNYSGSNTSMQSKTFHGYDCLSDCSGHQAGYDWARRTGVYYLHECRGNSQSFIEGCKAWVKF